MNVFVSIFSPEKISTFSYPESIVEESLVVELKVENLVVCSNGLIDAITITVGSREVKLAIK
jgi:hypothetical protein